jgi:hypothetical protein
MPEQEPSSPKEKHARLRLNCDFAPWYKKRGMKEAEEKED